MINWIVEHNQHSAVCKKSIFTGRVSILESEDYTYSLSIDDQILVSGNTCKSKTIEDAIQHAQFEFSQFFERMTETFRHSVITHKQESNI